MTYPVRLGLAIAALVILAPEKSAGRELRPSDHGLAYSPPADKISPSPAEAKSFFDGDGGGVGVALPKAMNANDTSSWWEEGKGGARGRDHVRDVLVVVSLLCGITGVVLFVASAFVYVIRYRKRKPAATTSSGLVVTQ